MSNFLTSRQPLLCKSLLGLCAISLIPAWHFNLESASAETSLSVGDQVTHAAALATLPDGPHQLCSEPEPEQYLGAGICFWFKKTGSQLVGYYGFPHSDMFIDCVSGTIQDEKVVGKAIAVSWQGAPFPNLARDQPLTWKTLTLGPGIVEYESSGDRSDIALISFPQAELMLRDYYRYSPAKVKLMNQPPTSCSVQDWIKQLASNSPD